MMNSMIISGNSNYGLAANFKEKFSSADFYSRSTGFDFLKKEDQKKFAKETLSYDVYISCSGLREFNQLYLLKSVYDEWKQNRKRGHIVVMGSAADTPGAPQDRIYSIEKRALRDYCQNISILSNNSSSPDNSGIRITYLSPGFLSTESMHLKYPDKNKIPCSYIPEIIEWLLLQPAGININSISLDAVQ